jgi:hypothetical protein
MFETPKLSGLAETVVFGRDVSLFTLTGSSLYRGLLFQLMPSLLDMLCLSRYRYFLWLWY